MGKRKGRVTGFSSSSSSSGGFDLMAIPEKKAGPAKTPKKVTPVISLENPLEQRRQTIREMRAFFTLSDHNKKYLIRIKEKFIGLLDIISPMSINVLIESSDDYDVSIMNLDRNIKECLGIALYEKGGIGDFCEFVLPQFEFTHADSRCTMHTTETSYAVGRTAPEKQILLEQFAIFYNDLQRFWHAPGYVPVIKPVVAASKMPARKHIKKFAEPRALGDSIEGNIPSPQDHPSAKSVEQQIADIRAMCEQSPFYYLLNEWHKNKPKEC